MRPGGPLSGAAGHHCGDRHDQRRLPQGRHDHRARCGYHTPDTSSTTASRTDTPCPDRPCRRYHLSERDHGYRPTPPSHCSERRPERRRGGGVHLRPARSQSPSPGRATRPGPAPSATAKTRSAPTTCIFGGSATDWVDLSQGRRPAGRRAAAAADQPHPGDEPGQEAAAAFLVLPPQPQGSGDRHRRRPRQQRHRGPVRPVPGQQSRRVVRWRTGPARASARTCIRRPHSRTAAAASYVAQGFEVGVHETTNCGNFTPASLRNVYANDIGGVEGPLHQPAEPGEQPDALHRVQRLGVAAQDGAGQRDADGRQLLLLARHLDPRPPGLHDRLGDADAVHRHRRQHDRHLPGGDAR